MSFTITKLTSKYDVSKKFVKEQDEKGDHKRHATPFSKGKAETVKFKNMYEFKEFMQSLGTKELIMMGIGDERSSFVAPKSQLSQYPGTIARSKENFPFTEEQGILFIDYDPSDGDIPLRKDLLLAQIFDIYPELKDAPMLWKPSSGSCIWNTEKEEWHVGIKGQHIFFLIDNQNKSKAIIYHLKERIDGIDVQTPQGNRLSYQGCTCEAPFEKRDEEFEVRNADQPSANTENYSDGTIKSEKESRFSALGKQSWDERYEEIEECRSYHENIRNLAWGMARDGMEEHMIGSTIRMAMRQVGKDARDDRWKTRYDDIDRQVKTAIDYYEVEVFNNGLDPDGKDITKDIKVEEEVYIPSQDNIKLKKAPEFPFGVMKDWPEPWNLIWENWSRFPRRLSEQLLIPTIISSHGYMLRGYYRNKNGRRPNMYWLTLAESTAHKDTNSSDVLRDLGKAMRRRGIMNSIFDSMHTCDSSITSDTAFVKSVESRKRERAVDEIDKARSRIIGTHKLCKGRGIIEKKRIDPKTGFVKSNARFCKCKDKFTLYSRFLLSNIHYESIRNQKIYNKKVINEVTLETFNLRELIIPYVKQIKRAVRSPYGFLFLGKPGTGKTFVGSKILYYAIANGLTAHSIEFSDFLKLLRKNFEEDLDSLIREISNVDILMIDEFGNESKRSDFAIGEFKSLYKRRVENNKPTIMISNYNYLEFKKAYGKSIESVVESHSKILNFDKVPDMRKIKGTIEMDTFFEKMVEPRGKRGS